MIAIETLDLDGLKALLAGEGAFVENDLDDNLEPTGAYPVWRLEKGVDPGAYRFVFLRHIRLTPEAAGTLEAIAKDHRARNGLAWGPYCSTWCLESRRDDLDAGASMGFGLRPDQVEAFYASQQECRDTR